MPNESKKTEPGNLTGEDEPGNLTGDDEEEVAAEVLQDNQVQDEDDDMDSDKENTTKVSKIIYNSR